MSVRLQASQEQSGGPEVYHHQETCNSDEGKMKTSKNCCRCEDCVAPRSENTESIREVFMLCPRVCSARTVCTRASMSVRAIKVRSCNTRAHFLTRCLYITVVALSLKRLPSIACLASQH